MRKGLTQALIAVAVVIMAAKVMAMAPIIGDIPSPIVGDKEDVTPGNTFVFPDAIDLTAYVTDQNADGSVNPPANIMWSYEIFGGTAKYRINNRDQLVGTDDPANPPAAKRIDGPSSADDDPAGTNDADSKITIRNINLSPIGGPNQNPSTTGILASENQLVTLYAGDGTTFTAKPIWFYTDNDGNDRLSGGAVPGGTPVYHETFTGTVGTWGYAKIGGVGNATSSYDATNGALCINTPALGDNLGIWTGPYGMLTMVDNAVYKIRAHINSSQSTAGLVPFWDMIINSYGYANPSNPNNNPATDVKGLNLYGGNYMFLDNTGSANAAVSASGMDFINYWCPSPVSTAQWKDTTEGTFPNGPGPYALSQAAAKDAFIEFRILDAASNTGTNSSVATGSLCLTELEITRFDVTQVNVVSNKLTQTAMTQGGLNGATGGGGNTRANALVGATASFANNTVTITPTGGDMLTLVEPGDYDFNLVTGASVLDNYPVAMTPQTLYRIKMDLSAPTTADQNAPVDIFWMGADTPTNELINLSYVTVNGWHHGMPKTGTPQTYTAFFYSNYGTANSNSAWFKQFRWRFMAGSNVSLGGGGEPNTGALRIHDVTVDEVTTQ